MFKRAKVLRVFDKSNYNKVSYSMLEDTLVSLNIQLRIYPEYTDFARNELIKELIPNSLFCITQSTNNTFTNFAFICYPMSSSNISLIAKPGEDIWYFEDETFEIEDIVEYPQPRFYWHSKISGSLSSETQSYVETSSSVSDLFTKEVNEKVNQSVIVESYIENQTNSSLNFRSRYFSNHNEVSLQGDDGNLIRLGPASSKNLSGSVDIVAGRNHYIFDGNDLNSLTDESKLLFEEDASRIFLSEGGYFDSLISDVYIDVLSPITNIRDKGIDNQNNFVFDASKNNVLVYEEKENFYEKVKNINTAENSSNLTLSDFKDDTKKPNVTVKSSTINLVAKKDNSNNGELETLGYKNEIRLIRESENISNSSQILLDTNNDISVDANTIYIGNINRILVDKNVISSDELNENDFSLDKISDEAKEKIKEMVGLGESILIGYEKSLSEPLVLGNTLNILLKDMIELLQMTIDQNRVLNDKVNALAQEYTTHIHPTAPEAVTVTVLTPAGVPFPAAPTGVGLTVPLPTQPTTNLASHQAFSTTDTVNIDTDLNDIQTKLEEVKSNLKYMLSRFAKTSWRYTYLIKEKCCYVEFR